MLTSLVCFGHSPDREFDARIFAHEKLQPPRSGPPYRVVPLVQRKVDNEGFVRFEKSRYSVPPEHCGKTVSVELRGEKIVIRCQDLILAEHEPAARPGSCMAHEEHLQQLWKCSTAPNEAPLPSWQLRHDQAVVVIPLSVYEREVA